MNLLNSLLTPDSLPDFVILGGIVGCVGYIGFQISRGSLPGVVGMIAPAASGAILGAMLYIFASGMSGG